MIKHTEIIFRKLVDPQLRDSLQTDIRSFEQMGADDEGHSEVDQQKNCIPRTLPNELASILSRAGITAPSTAHLPANTTIHGLTFSTYSQHKGNSSVILTDSTPAHIQHIIRLPAHPKISYLVIRRFKPSTRHYDPYLQHPLLRAALWDAQLLEMELVTSKDVISHFALLRYDIKNVAILPLSKSIPL